MPEVESFPLDSARRFAEDVVNHARSAFDFVRDTARHVVQKTIRQMGPAHGHEIDGFDHAQPDDSARTSYMMKQIDRFERQLEDLRERSPNR